MFGPQSSSTTRESKKEQPNKAADLLDLIQEVRQMKQELTSMIEAQREELTFNEKVNMLYGIPDRQWTIFQAIDRTRILTVCFIPP